MGYGMPEKPELDTGGRMHELAGRLFPLFRSITGDGLRLTLDTIAEYIPLQRYQLATGKQVFDWQIPISGMPMVIPLLIYATTICTW